ncbi:MAG: YXWGXW repeat-containing protein [Bryobacterales bacterium]|nr:YXWGXW repeat-containing protein [Bryobacterales bacterium]
MTNKIAAAALLIGGTAFAQYPSSPGYPNYNPNYSGAPNYQAGPYNSGPYDSSGAYQQPYDGQYDPGQPGYAAPAPPPAPAYAYQPPAPGPGYLWIDGFWNFAGGRYVWSNGYWTLPPYGGSYWVAPRYYGGRFYGGHWGGSGFVRHDNFRYTAPRGFDRGERGRSDFRGREGHGGRR